MTLTDIDRYSKAHSVNLRGERLWSSRRASGKLDGITLFHMLSGTHLLTLMLLWCSSILGSHASETLLV